MKHYDEITLADYKRLTAAHPRRAKKAPRADIPRAPRDEPTGLTALLVAGWSTQTPDCVRYRLYQGWGARLDTGMQPTLKAACDRAKELTKEHNDA